MPNSICPRNSIFHRLFLNWGENIPKYFRSCSRVLKAIMLSFPVSVPFVVFCAWLFYHIQQLEPIFRLFHFQKLISPNKTRPLIVFRGQKLGIFQNLRLEGFKIPFSHSDSKLQLKPSHSNSNLELKLPHSRLLTTLSAFVPLS